MRIHDTDCGYSITTLHLGCSAAEAVLYLVCPNSRLSLLSYMLNSLQTFRLLSPSWQCCSDLLGHDYCGLCLLSHTVFVIQGVNYWERHSKASMEQSLSHMYMAHILKNNLVQTTVHKPGTCLASLGRAKSLLLLCYHLFIAITQVLQTWYVSTI